MDNIIYWYSGTGNSLSAARRLAEHLHGETVLLPVTALLYGYEQPAASVYGFVFPLYGAEAPWPVLEAIKQLKLPENAYTFAAATCNERGGVALDDLNNFMMDHGMKLSYGRRIDMPGNCLPSSDEENAERLRYEESDVQRIADNVNRRMLSSFHGGNPHMKTVEDRRSSMHRAGLDRWVVNDSCIRCGTCASLCPMHNITLKDGIPQFGNECGFCFACWHWCPAKALSLAEFPVFSPEGRSQYRHPDISADDLREQSEYGKNK